MLFLKRIVHKETAETIHREKDSVPATGPTTMSRRRRWTTPIALRDFGVIASVTARSCVRNAAGPRWRTSSDRFRLDPPFAGIGFRTGRDLLQIRDNMRERFSAYVSRDAVADA